MASTYPGQQATAPSSGGAPVPDSYFTESRKGEINELRNLLRGFATERNPQRKRDIIKKVIAYMTLGIDVSRLFSEMMMAIETRDLVIKKMVYLYLTNYATSSPELAQMCTNTLQKDCGNEDPMVRGLALRALCSINLPQMVEYIAEPLRRGLSDGHPYVRKTAVMGILKLYHLDTENFENSGFVDVLYEMLRDPDAQVVTNCIIVLNEIMQHSPAGGMIINRAIMLHLLNRIHEFNEFAKVQVLELVPRYIPANEDEGYQIMNLLDPVLQTASSGAVMATIRAFLSLAEHLGNNGDDSTMQRQIVDRVKAPLVTAISSGSSEMMFALLKHVYSLCLMCPGSFDDEYRQFFVRYSEPTHVKFLKVTILAELANPDTAPDIVSELAEWVSSAGSEKLSRLAIQSMASIGCSSRGGPGASEAIARRLVEMLDMSIDHVCGEAASALLLMVRKHATLKPLIAPPLVRSLKYTHEQKAKGYILSLIAECGDIIPEAPYALEKMIDNYEDITDLDVKQALLTSAVRLFFVRPPEMQNMLGRLLSKATDDVSSQDLHDRALWYYRMLLSGGDFRSLESVVRTSTHIAESAPFSEDNDDELRKELMEEFNTLSMIYGKPSTVFIGSKFQVKYTKMPEEHPLSPGDANASFDVGATNSIPAQQATPAVAPQEVDLLGFGGGAPASPSSTATPAPAPSSGLSLNSSYNIAGDEFQSRWESINDAEAFVSTVALRSLPPNTDAVETALANGNIMTMASGELPAEFKFFLYGQDTPTGAIILVQSNIDKSSPQDPLMIITVKISGLVPSGQAMTDQLTGLMTNLLS